MHFFLLSFVLKSPNVIFASARLEFEWKTISQGFPPLPPASSRTEQNCFQWSSVHVLMFFLLQSQIFRTSKFSSFSGFDWRRWRLSVLICCSMWCWSAPSVEELPVRPSPSARNKTFSNRKQTSDDFIYPRRAIQFCKKKKKRKEKMQSNKSLSVRDNQSMAQILTAR